MSALHPHAASSPSQVQRKIAIEQMLKSTPQQNEEENLILAEYKLIEDKRKSEAAAAAAANKKAQAAAAQAAAAAAAASAPPAAPGPSPFAGNPSEVQLLHPSEFPNRPGPGIPSLFDGSLNPSKMVSDLNPKPKDGESSIIDAVDSPSRSLIVV